MIENFKIKLMAFVSFFYTLPICFSLTLLFDRKQPIMFLVYTYLICVCAGFVLSIMVVVLHQYQKKRHIPTMDVRLFIQFTYEAYRRENVLLHFIVDFIFIFLFVNNATKPIALVLLCCMIFHFILAGFIIKLFSFCIIIYYKLRKVPNVSDNIKEMIRR